MKRLIRLLLALCVMCVCCGVFSACKGPSVTDVHAFADAWTTDETYHWHACVHEEGCTETYLKAEHTFTEVDGELTCAVCGFVKDEQQTHQHSYSQEWVTDEGYHWNVCQVENCGVIANREQHTFNEDVCSVCGYALVDDFNGEVTKEQWDLAVIAEKFNNVTVSYQLYHEDMGNVKASLMVDGDKVYKTMNDPVLNLGYIGEQAKAQKGMVFNLFMGLIEKYENFTYDAEQGIYISTDTITTTVTDEVSNYTTIETMTNGRVKFAEDYTIEWLMCDMTETIYSDTFLVHSATYEDMYFTFTNFGTTVVDFETEVPSIPQFNYTEVTEEQWKASMRIDFDCEIKQTLTLLVNDEFYYVMEDGYTRSGNVIKFSDWYISIEGDKYYEYFYREGSWTKSEIAEEHYIRMATFATLIDAFDSVTFDAETGFYVCDVVDLGDGDAYYNFKAGFVDGKLAYVYYEDKTEGGNKPVYQCYVDYKTVEVTLPSVAE